MPQNAAQKSLRDAFGEAILELGSENEKVVVLTADLAESTRVHHFENKFPGRFFQVGVAEQNMAGIASGLASAGKIPFITSYSAFSPYGNWSQIRTSICYSEANVKIVGAHAGLSASAHGPTHMALEDIALTRVLPNLTVVTPCDCVETKKAVKAIANYPWPVYLRLFREPSDILTKESDTFEIGKATVLQQGNDVTIIGCGPILGEAIKASEGLSCEIINISTIKPLDKETILKSARKTKKVITVEEHQVAGGLGSAVCEVLAREFPVPVTMIGIEDSFTESGNYREIMDKYGLTAKHIAGKILEVLG